MSGPAASPPRTTFQAAFLPVNFADLRDVLSVGALLSRTLGRPRVVTAGGLLESLKPADRENVWPLVRMLMRGGGDLLVGSPPSRPPRGGVVAAAPPHPAAHGTR